MWREGVAQAGFQSEYRVAFLSTVQKHPCCASKPAWPVFQTENQGSYNLLHSETKLQTLQFHNRCIMKNVNKIIRFLLVLTILIGSLLSQNSVVFAQSGQDSLFFSETGHNVRGAFLKFYQSFSNPKLVIGYPITEEFIDAKSGRKIQYFTRARFELYSDVDKGSQVRLSPLGQYIYDPGKNPSVDIFTPLGCRSFSNGKSACYAFLDFFDKNGGEAVFGMPISSFEFLNGRVVQYFERARFDWYPEYKEGEKVVLSNLGSIYFDFSKENPELLKPQPPNGIPEKSSVLSVQVRAFVWKAVIQPPDAQTVYVIVQDQNLQPVEGALAEVTIFWTEGTPQNIHLWTNKYGVVVIPFEVKKDQAYGDLVTVSVTVVYDDLPKQTTITSFRIWK